MAAHGFRTVSVQIMQSADSWNGGDAIGAEGFDLLLDRRVSLQREMCSRSQVVLEIRTQDALEMAFVENYHMVGAFAANCTDEAFAIRVASVKAV